MNMKQMSYTWVLTISLFGSLTAGAAEITWDNSGGDNDFTNASNWAGNVAPVEGDTALINLTGSDRAVLSGGSSENLRSMIIENGAFEQTGGALNADKVSSAVSSVGAGTGTAGSWTMSGGTANINAIRIAVGAGSAGTMSITGGDVLISRGFGRPASSLFVGYGGTAGFELSGSSRLDTRAGVSVGTSVLGGSGVFSVTGSSVGSITLGASQIGIGSLGTVDGFWDQGANGTLKMAIDAGGVSKLFIDEVNGTFDHYATFAAGSLLDLGFSGTPEEAGSWTLMELENTDITDNGLALAADVDSSDGDGIGWSFAVDNSGSNGLLVATYAVPEPASLVLLLGGIGSLSVIRRSFHS